ncbi:MAG: hypothetical protein OEY77_00245 [Nitrospira sp.]|nr:hypothetical protein [Nitrospira sp.]
MRGLYAGLCSLILWSGSALAQTPVYVSHLQGAFQWDLQPFTTENAPESHVLTCGGNSVTVPMPATSTPITDVVPGPGQYTCVLYAQNGAGRQAEPDVPFPLFESGYVPGQPFQLQVLAEPEPPVMASRLQNGITTHSGVTNMTRAFSSNVSSGSLLVVSAARWRSFDSALYIAGDLTKSAGTATIGSPTLHYSAAAGSHQVVGIWSVLVTGSGSLTLQVAHPSGGTYGSVVAAEYSGTWDSSRTEASNTGTGTGAAADSGNATSAGAAVFIGALTTDHSGTPALTEDAAFSLLGEDEDASARIQHAAIERIVASGTTDSASWTIGASTWVTGVVVFKEASGGGGAASSRYHYVANQ